MHVRSAARLESDYLHNLSFRLKWNKSILWSTKFSHTVLDTSAVTQSLLLQITGNFCSNFRKLTSVKNPWFTSVRYGGQFCTYALPWITHALLSLFRKLETEDAALMSYGRQFHIADAAQRKARDPIFVWDEHGSSCLPSAEDLSARRKIFLVIQDLRYFDLPDCRSLYVKVATL